MVAERVWSFGDTTELLINSLQDGFTRKRLIQGPLKLLHLSVFSSTSLKQPTELSLVRIERWMYSRNRRHLRVERSCHALNCVCCVLALRLRNAKRILLLETFNFQYNDARDGLILLFFAFRAFIVRRLYESIDVFALRQRENQVWKVLFLCVLKIQEV